MKRIKWESLLFALVYIGCGAVLLMYPSEISEYSCTIFGVAVIAYGLINIVQYFLKSIDATLYTNEFSSGILKMVVGIMVIYHEAEFKAIMPYLLALAIMMSGFNKLQDAIDAKRMGSSTGVIYVILALMSVVCGLVVMFEILPGPVSLLQLAGAGLIYSGATDLFSSIYLSGKIRRFKAQEEREEAEAEAEKRQEEEKKAEPVAEEPEEVTYTTRMKVINADYDLKPEPLPAEPVKTPEPVMEQEPVESGEEVKEESSAEAPVENN